MHLGKAESLAVFYYHNGGIRDIDTYLYHDGRDQDMDLSALEFFHYGGLFFSRELSVKKSRGMPRVALLYLIVEFLYRKHFFIFVFNARCHHIGQAPVIEFTSHVDVCALSCGRIECTRDYLFSVLRHRPDYTEVHVAEHRCRQSSRNRCRTHYADIHRFSFLHEGPSLRDSEAVLLVRDDKSKISEGDILLDKSVRAYKHIGPAAGRIVYHAPPL